MTNTNKFKKAIDLLEGFALDYQFDLDHPLYHGFINVGIDLLPDPTDKETYICENRVLFMLVLPELGLATEEGLDIDETVFVRK
jgi:hypothetical protein